MFLQSQLSGRVLKSMYSCGRGLMLQEHSVDHQITGKHCIHMHCTVNLDERKKNLFYLIMWIKLSCLWLPFADISRISKLNFCQMEEIDVPASTSKIIYRYNSRFPDVIFPHFSEEVPDQLFECLYYFFYFFFVYMYNW